MIEEIKISQVASFSEGEARIDQLNKFNFFFGANGSGKTTISRILADPEQYEKCQVKWVKDTPLKTLVYNQDFVKHNFNQSAELKGVFTLGEDNIETSNKIAEAKSEKQKNINKINALKLKLKDKEAREGFLLEKADLEEQFREKCWESKKRHEEHFKRAFEGFLRKEAFAQKVYDEGDSNPQPLATLDDLKDKAGSVFGDALTLQNRVPPVNFSLLNRHSENPILSKRVLGKEDVDISAMIQKLGNSDWVRAGIQYYEENGDTCPFCQQSTTEKFRRNLNEYFDETFERDSKLIDDLIGQYHKDRVEIINQIDAILKSKPQYLDIQKLKDKKETLRAEIANNVKILMQKKGEPSQAISLSSMDGITNDINELIGDANRRIQSHNDVVRNIADERRTLTQKVWKFISHELRGEISSFRQKEKELDRKIQKIKNEISRAEASLQEEIKKIEILERRSSSIRPTLDNINLLLKNFGFHNFSLAEAEEKTSYKLIREDGSDAHETLSDGERTFVTFLYFYSLVKGSQHFSGITSDRVVVLDDPVSSLNSETLFIVSTLIKQIFCDVAKGTGHIKQVIVLTHNTYFHREVSFVSKWMGDNRNKGRKFWIVRKREKVSELECFETENPVSTAYELLWKEVQNPTESSITIANTLRRILEHYFKIIGRVDLEELYEKLEGNDKSIGRNLFSWAHDGSHGYFDDLYHSAATETPEAYLKVFHEIFKKSGHEAHYKMMMGEDNFVGAKGEDSSTTTPMPSNQNSEISPEGLESQL